MAVRESETRTDLLKVVQNGRVTIPLKIREELGIKDGDTVRITVSKIIFD